MKSTDEKIQIKIITENVNIKEFELPFYAEIKENLISMEPGGHFECYYNGGDSYRSIVVKEGMTMEDFIHEIDLIVNKGVREVEFSNLSVAAFNLKKKLFIEGIKI